MSGFDALDWFRQGQHVFNDQIVGYLAAIQEQHALAAYAGLALVGFLYGIVHAIGPGHGKVVVSSYVLANENSLKRGLLVVALSSLLQAVTAVAVVVGFYQMLALSRTQAEHAATILEAVSFLLVAAVGARLAAQGADLLWQAKAHHHHDQCGCGHNHMPAPQDLMGKTSLLAMILAIGLRPCSGALLLLFFACRFDLAWPGALATLTMAVGTALTTGALAVLAVKSRHLALSLAERSDRLIWMSAGLRLAGGVVILVVAILFLVAQIGAEMPAAAQNPLYRSIR